MKGLSVVHLLKNPVICIGRNSKLVSQMISESRPGCLPGDVRVSERTIIVHSLVHQTYCLVC